MTKADMTDDIQSALVSTGKKDGKEWAKLEVTCDTNDPLEILLNVTMSISAAFNTCPICLSAELANTFCEMEEEGRINHGIPQRVDN